MNEIKVEDIPEIIAMAKAEGIHKDMLKSELMTIMGNQSKYTLRGHAGAKSLGHDLGEAFRIIDDTWDAQEENCNAND